MSARAAEAYRPCTAIALFGRDGRVLVAERIDLAQAAWQLPQGGIDSGETAPQAALREMREELGTDRARVIGEASGWIAYDLPDAVQGVAWGGRWRGQRVKLVALGFTGADDDIDLGTPHPEFRAWKWVALEALPDLIVAFKRPLYEAAVTAFAPLRDRIRATGRFPPAPG